jgi:hypothetical protein
MLDNLGYAGQGLPGNLGQFLQQPVVLPEVLLAMLDTPPEGRTARHQDRRRYARLACRGLMALHPLSGPPELRRDPQWQYVVSRNIAMGGLGVFHVEQLYPTERAVVVLLDARLRELVGMTHSTAVVRRCRRIGEGCYEIGMAFLREDDQEEEAEGQNTTRQLV